MGSRPASLRAALTTLNAEQLRHSITDAGAPLPDQIAVEADCLEVLRYTATLGDPHLTAVVDERLREAERQAINGATPTPYAREVIVAAHHAGRPLAIVSNNSEPAIWAYLTVRRLTGYITHVTGRVPAHPELMKPHPRPVRAAVAALEAEPAGCVLVGDSPSDIQAAHAAGVHTIGYANKPGKHERLTAAGAEAIAEGEHGMAQLARLLHGEADLT
jgi:HAD superfamily hydrolase (TIGR01509 family)